MHSVITVLGKDKTGIISTVSRVIAAHKANILDISQTTMQKTFVMMMMIDVEENNYKSLREDLQNEAKELQMTINTYHEDVYNAMHRI